MDDFYTIRIPEYVVVAPFTDAGDMLLERHYRHGPRSVTWSLPSGYVDPGETPPNAARRELREETGFEAESWHLLGRFAVDGNRGCGWANLFMADRIRRAGPPSHQDLGEMEVRLVPLSVVIARLYQAEMEELASAAALALALLKRGSVA